MSTSDTDIDPEFRPIFENRVRFAETDLQGVVFYGEYFTFQDEAVSEFFRQIDYGYEQMERDGWQVHVANTELNYRDAAEFGDELVNEIRVAEIGTASITFEYRITRSADEQVLADGTVTHVAVDLETGETRPIPDAFREAVAAFQGGLEASD
ncbi:acyl-CoA thioesterase [Natronolimnohabitans innermongolicus]|uniref:Thioesterase superfamily protein n=1 Tax=Natronolimnohabitans innermongolicus JCM 12255 TaxID=1227499 RepID=L9XHL3_9EURY|nr:thioesterase family protein [Natronolimnohabitans innermongolicus]ELY61205.1 thioesterase superfamily protein [Natronolimnohabitans innermongolicus JCM 12255]